MEKLGAFCTCWFLLTLGINHISPEYIQKSYSNFSVISSFIILMLVLCYIYIIRPIVKDVYGTKRIQFGKYRGEKWKNLPTPYLEWVSHSFNDSNKFRALKELKYRNKKATLNTLSYEHTLVGVIEKQRKCWKCQQNTKVIAIKFFPTMNDNHSGIQEYLQHLDRNILEVIQNKYPFYQYRYSKTAQIRYLANCCIHCKSLQGDFQLHQEIDGPFLESYKLKCNQFLVINNGKVQFSNVPK